MKTVLAIAMLMLGLAVVSSAAPGQVVVRWTMPSTNLDGTALTDLAGAVIYWGTASSNYTRRVMMPGGAPGQQMQAAITGLVAGVTYYLNGTAYNTAGLESDFCAQAVKQAAGMPTSKPGAVQTLTPQPVVRVIGRYELVNGRYVLVLVTQRWDEATKAWIDQ